MSKSFPLLTIITVIVEIIFSFYYSQQIVQNNISYQNQQNLQKTLLENNQSQNLLYSQIINQKSLYQYVQKNGYLPITKQIDFSN